MGDIINNNKKLEYVKQYITTYPDFPKKDVLFRDIFGALLNGRCCQYLKELLVTHIRDMHPDVDLIVGLESRGFLFNLMVASDLGIGCAPIRKKGKLPGDCLSIEYSLEYGSDVFEMQYNAIKPGQKVIIIDDLLASGGSLATAIELVRKAGGNVMECLVVIELLDLHGSQRLDAKVHSLIQY